MPISNGDLVEYTSATAGSTGGAITGSTITSGAANNVWSDVTDSARLAGGTTYKKTFWKNINATQSAGAPVIYTPVLPTNMTLQVGFGINSSDDNYSTQGNMTAWSSNAVVSLTSDGADTRNVTIVGLDTAGPPGPAVETIALNGLTEVLTATTFSKVYAVYIASTSGTRSVTVKQGSGGTTRGTIGINRIICWLWITAGSKGAGIKLSDLAALQSYGVWRKLSWTAAAGAVKPNTLTVTIEENA